MLEGLEPPKNKTEFCKVDHVISQLEESDAKILQEALDDTERWKHKTLSNALRSRGISLADTTISKHRFKVCACFRG